MDIALPSDVKQQLKVLQQVVAELEEKLPPCLSKDSSDKATALEKAELHVTTAQAIQSLFCLYLRAHGTSPDEHAIAKEEERINRYKRKVSKVNSEVILKNSKRATEVNVQAANRFITAAIPELSRDQKQALKQAGAKRTSTSSVAGHHSEQSKPIKDQALRFLQETMQEIHQA